MGVVLYSWQEECIDAWFANGCRGIVNVVTGAGKTICALSAMRRLEEAETRPVRVRILTPTIPLMRQWDKALRAFLEEDGKDARREIGHFGGSRKDGQDRRYTIYVINSARYHLARQILADWRAGYAVLLIADECHRYASGENRKIFEFLPYIKEQTEGGGAFYSMGLSATPHTAGFDTVLVPALGKEIYRYGFAKAAKKAIFCPFCIYQIAVPFTGGEKQEYEEMSEELARLRGRLFSVCRYLRNMDSQAFFAQLQQLAAGAGQGKTSAQSGRSAGQMAKQFLAVAYKRKGLVCMAAARIQCVCDLIEQLGIQKKIMIFGERIEQAEAVYEKLAGRYPERVGRYHSGMGDQANRNALERFRTGSIRILITCRALDEGIDVPDAQIGIILSGTAAKRQRIQRLGRILRRGEGKELACLYYLFIRESSEESSYFAERGEEFTTGDLFYLPQNGSFAYPEYEKAAFAALRELELQWKRIYPPEKVDDLLAEAETCLAAGLVRPDWLAGEEVIVRKKREAKSAREKNYWLCMERAAASREP